MTNTREKSYLSHYERSIEKMDPAINPVGVEASMRLQYGTLDHLSRAEFLREIDVARTAEGLEPGYLRECAESYDRTEAFERWENERQ